jgi:hypothetical protein
MDQLAYTRGTMPAERLAYISFCTCGTGSSALRLIFSTKCRSPARRSAFSTITFDNASDARIGDSASLRAIDDASALAIGADCHSRRLN